VYHVNKEIRDNFHSLAEIDLLIETKQADSDSASKAGLFTLVRDFSRTMEGYRGVSAVQSFTDQLEFEQRHSLPGFRIVLFPRIRNPFVTQDREKYRINIKLADPEDIWKVNDQIIAGFHPYKEKYQLGIYSDFLFFHFINASVTRSLMKSLVLSGILILVILFLLTRNLRVTAVTTLANLIPLGFLVVVMVLFRIEMSVAASMTLVVSLGVVVDDTIHILYRRIFLDRPLEELGFGVVTTSLILFAGFFSFILSSSLPNQIFGVLCSSAFLVAIVSDLAVMSWLIREKTGDLP
jgi:predicted RND superfamily exporter protein